MRLLTIIQQRLQSLFRRNRQESIAGYLPARRASQVNPAIVLRCDG